MTSELFSQRVPIRGAGSMAPGMDLRVFIMRKTIDEIRPKIGDSADAMSHFTAAAHVSALWEQSVPLRNEDDRYNSKGDSALKKVHKRLAKMRIGEDAYLVKITVKSFKNKNSLPIFYTVKTIKISQ